MFVSAPTTPNGARVLENSYYWRHPPPFIGLLSRTGLGVAPLGSRHLSCLRSNPVCPDSLPPSLRRIFVQLKRAESEQVFKRVPDLVRFAAIDSSRISRKFRNSQCRIQSCIPTHVVVVRIAPPKLCWKNRAARTLYFIDLRGHALDARLVPTVGRCSCPKSITSQKAKRLFCSKHSLLW